MEDVRGGGALTEGSLATPGAGLSLGSRHSFIHSVIRLACIYRAPMCQELSGLLGIRRSSMDNVPLENNLGHGREHENGRNEREAERAAGSVT